MEGLFKTALNGFRKEDVLNFIDGLESKYRVKENSLVERIAELNSSLAREKEEKQALLSKASDSEQRAAAAEEKAQEFTQELLQTREEADASRMQLLQLKADNESLQQRVQSLTEGRETESETERMKDAEIRSLRAQVAELTDALEKSTVSESRISRVMIEAQSAADRIMVSAREDSKKIIDEAREKMGLLLLQADDFQKEIAGIRTSVNEALGRTAEMLMAVEESARQVRDRYSDEFEQETDLILTPPSDGSEADAEDSSAKAADFDVDSVPTGWNEH